jgi:hypothetical protein
MTRTCDLRFRKPSLYPAELRDRSPADSRGRLEAPYQSGRVIASLRGEAHHGGSFGRLTSIWANPIPTGVEPKTVWRDEAAEHPWRRQYGPGGVFKDWWRRPASRFDFQTATPAASPMTNSSSIPPIWKHPTGCLILRPRMSSFWSPKSAPGFMMRHDSCALHDPCLSLIGRECDASRRKHVKSSIARTGKIAGNGVTSRPIMTTIRINCVVEISC